MLIYILNFLSIPLYSVFVKNKHVSVCFLCTQMFLILALRSADLGSDMLNYKNYFYHWGQYSFKELVTGTRFFLGHRDPWGLESGYVWLNWICLRSGLGFRGFIVLHAGICMASLNRFLTKHAKNPEMALALIVSLGIFQSYFYILRQMLALSVLMFSADAVRDRKPLRFMMLVCLAVLFHRAAVFFLPVYILRRIKITRNILMAVFLLLLAEIVLIPVAYSKLFQPVLDYVGKGSIYTLGVFEMNHMILLMAVFMLYIWIMQPRTERISSTDYPTGFWSGSLMLFTEAFSLYVPVMSRIAIAMLLPFLIPAVADVIPSQHIRNNKVILSFVCYGGLFLFYCIQLQTSSIVPYMAVWD